MTTFPYESSIAVKPVTVRWCPEAECYEAPWSPGECWMCDGWAGADKPHRFRKRRMWVCPVCERGYLTRSALLEHEHYYE